MEPKKAITVLTGMLKKYSFDDEEKETIIAAIGALDCAALAQSRLQGIIKTKRSERNKGIISGERNDMSYQI